MVDHEKWGGQLPDDRPNLGFHLIDQRAQKGRIDDPTSWTKVYVVQYGMVKKLKVPTRVATL